MSAQVWLMIVGALLIVLGIFVRWRMSRYDLKDVAIDSAWTLERGRRTSDNPTALEAKYQDIRSQPTWGGRAKKTAGTVIGHFAAQVLGVVSLVMVAVGLLAIAVGYFWR